MSTPPPEIPNTEESSDDTAPVSGPVDQLGIPMDRQPTIDDVRSDGEAHRRLAIGCSLLVSLFVIGFWILRVYVM